MKRDKFRICVCGVVMNFAPSFKNRARIRSKLVALLKFRGAGSYGQCHWLYVEMKIIIIINVRQRQ